jgi:hypothetical protein
VQLQKSLTCLALSLLGVTNLLRAQGIPGYTLQETMLVPVTGSSVVSQTTLLQGVLYKLKAVGTAQTQVNALPGFGVYEQSDAEYAFDFSSSFPFFPNDVDHCPIPSVDIGLAVNDTNNNAAKTPYWGNYNTAHIYTTNITGTGAPISVNYHNCTYLGSQGLLTVQIFRPMSLTLNVPPTYTDVSPSLQTFPRETQQSVSGRANTVAVASNNTRLYAGTFSGVWRSDDAGLRWRQMTQPQPAAGIDTVAGALYIPDVYDIAVSPQNPDIVMAAVASDLRNSSMTGIYRSVDGGNTWSLVHQFDCPTTPSPVGQIVFAPDNANLVYAAGGCAVGLSSNGGQTWTERSFVGSSTVLHIAVGSLERSVAEPRATTGIGITPFEIRRIYALGYNQILYSTDGGQTWMSDTGVSSIPNGFGTAAGSSNGNSSRILMIEPDNNQHVLMSDPGHSNGPSYYLNPACGAPTTVADGTTCNATPARGCGEGSIWLGDYTGFVPSDPSHHSAVWSQLSSPPTYWGVTSPSGNTYVAVKPIQNSYLVFLADMSHVHVSMGLPTAGGWHRMEGLDASQTAPPNPPNPYCNNLHVHADPHAIALSQNFSMSLQSLPSTIPAPYNENTVAAPASTGDIWMANDGGVYHARGASPSFQPADGLSTLATLNIAGLAAKGLAPALYFGSGDNADFYSLDGGSSWNIPHSYCGDCDAWFADPAQVGQVMGFMPLAGGGGFYVFTNNAKYPDAQTHPTDGTTFAHWYCPTACNASSSYWIRGYRPMVLSTAGTTAPATGDYIVIGTKSDGTRAVFRKTNAAPMNAATDWENPANANQYGPALPVCGNNPTCIDAVQASGGHTGPVLYAGDPANGPNDDTRHHYLTLWKWTPPRLPRQRTVWQQIVPSPNSAPAGKTASNAYRFYADPYNPNTIYIMDDSAIKRSDDGGTTWQVDTSLDNAITENHRYSYTADYSVIKDMIFVRGEDKTRFAVGSAGVFYTLDGTNWRRLLSTSALPSHPVAAYFDNISDPCDRALYVGLAGRGMLRIDPIPPPGNIVVINRPCLNQVVNAP